MGLNVTVEGDDELAKRLDPNTLLGPPFRRALDRSGIAVTNRAKRGTPVWQGRLRSSMAHEVDTRPIPLWCKVGSNVVYAPFVENDTRPHFPPISAIAPWANSKGIPPFLVARAIARRGTKGAHMLEKGLKDSQGDIANYFRQAEQEIVAAASGGSAP